MSRQVQAHFTDLAGVDRAIELAERWQDDLAKKAEALWTKLAFRWHAEAVKRCPVDTGILRNSLLHNIYYESGSARTGPLVAEVGTNISFPEPYGEIVEFGNKWIAGGAVLAIGKRPDISDFDAVHTWPAKEADATDKTSYSIITESGEGDSRLDQRTKQIKHGKGPSGFRGRLLNKAGELLKARPQEQMPWLRPAFFHIREWAREQVLKLFEVR